MKRLILLSILLSIPLPAVADRFQVNDRTPGHENDTVEIKRVQPVLVCAPDMSCVGFSEQQVSPLAEVEADSSIVTAPSGGARFLTGVQTGSSFGNLFMGIVAAVELPITRRFELDLRDVFDPVEQHYPYGNGWANQATGGGIIWVTRAVGLNASYEYSNYHTQRLSKHGDYFYGGVTYRTAKPGIPMRFTFDYLREIHNGIDATGTESAHLQGGQFNLDMRVACHLNLCFRVQFDFKVGRVLTQGNPICDGTLGVTGGPGGGPCPRTAASSGAFTGAVLVEFPRRRAMEQLAF